MSGVQEPTGAVGTDKDRGESEIVDNHRVKKEQSPSQRNTFDRERNSAHIWSRNNYGQDSSVDFESDGIPKVFFDVRNDSAAMFHQYQVELAGIYDLEVMEVGTRARPGKYLAGLAKCISRDVPMTPFEKANWRATKERGKTLFSLQHGGSYEVINARPLSKEVVEYCVQDVQFLPRLWQTYSRALTPTLRQKAQAESQTTKAMM
ncbi:hypothetical protein M752DRAFT_267480 [Aspergillus phoenicis ATCC 13157]|uniref:3'-5' exonuclease domain-containing protein n=1 Tax=Aspergillus phoenicis ATCC 13157 TaxID=1353007 RepID=A0A370PG66_ASPPH|nr:hypothetical protein M752DRAFT_267480 [Aspergillus phoenicis ATCC 13157]